MDFPLYGARAGECEAGSRGRVTFGGWDFSPAFARCCFCIAANLLVFTSPMMLNLSDASPPFQSLSISTTRNANLRISKVIEGKTCFKFPAYQTIAKSFPCKLRHNIKP